jgi:dTDP-4-amino-4,6-dideoxygalactose transaminase
MYYILLDSLEQRGEVIAAMKAQGVSCVFHYVPLHSAPYGVKHSRHVGDMTHTNTLSDRLLRLPLWVGLEDEQDRVLRALREAL